MYMNIKNIYKWYKLFYNLTDYQKTKWKQIRAQGLNFISYYQYEMNRYSQNRQSQ